MSVQGHCCVVACENAAEKAAFFISNLPNKSESLVCDGNADDCGLKEPLNSLKKVLVEKLLMCARTFNRHKSVILNSQPLEKSLIFFLFLGEMIKFCQCSCLEKKSLEQINKCDVFFLFTVSEEKLPAKGHDRNTDASTSLTK